MRGMIGGDLVYVVRAELCLASDFVDVLHKTSVSYCFLVLADAFHTKQLAVLTVTQQDRT